MTSSFDMACLTWRMCLWLMCVFLCSSLLSPETHFTYKPLGIREYFHSQVNMSQLEGVAITFTPHFPLSFPLVLYTLMDRIPHNWATVIFTYNERITEKKELLSVLFQGTSYLERVHVLTLSYTFSPRIFSCVVMSPQFYEDLPAPWVLLFQMDTIILRRDDYQHDRSPHRYLFLRDFFSYPYLGAPWSFRHCSESPLNPCRDGGNGGLSLRSRDFMIKVTSDEHFVVKKHRKGNCENEDTSLSDFMISVPTLFSLSQPFLLYIYLNLNI